MVGDVYFVVLPGPGMEDTPCKYHDEIPAKVIPDIRYALRLEEDQRDASCSFLMQTYVIAKAEDALPPSNVVGADYAGRY